MTLVCYCPLWQRSTVLSWTINLHRHPFTKLACAAHRTNELLQSLLDGSPRKQLKPGRQRLMEGSSLKSTVDGV